MAGEGLLEKAERELESREQGKRLEKAPRKKPPAFKYWIAAVLLLILAGSAWRAWNEIRRMNTPPDVPEEVLVENMGGYLFITVSKLNSHIEGSGEIPAGEEDFLGWDDPSVEYAVNGSEYSVSVIHTDTTLVWHSGEDPGKYLTEDALRRMGIAD